MINFIFIIMVESVNSDGLSKALAGMEDWYRAVIFNKDLKVVAKKNLDSPNEGELKYFP